MGFLDMFKKQSAPPPVAAEIPEHEEEAPDSFPLDERRDPALEAQDDAARFDFANDIESWYRAHREIEMAWEDTATRAALFQRHGLRDVQHFRQVDETAKRFVFGAVALNAQQDSASFARLKRELTSNPDGYDEPAVLARAIQTARRYTTNAAQLQRFGTDLGTAIQVQMDAYTQMHQQQLKQHVTVAQASGELSPVEGVDLTTWARAQAALASGTDVNQILAGLRLDRAAWDRIGAEWMARMSRDSTFAISSEYSKAFSTSGQGQFAASASAATSTRAQQSGASHAGNPPIPFEQWVEIQEAQNAASQQGRDVNQLLAHYGMDPLAWSNASLWWSQYWSANAMRDNGALQRRFVELQAHFEQKFRALSADADVRF